MAKVPIRVLKPFGSYLPGPAHIDEGRLPYLKSKGLAEEFNSSPENAEPAEQEEQAENLLVKFLKENLSAPVVDVLVQHGLDSVEAIDAVGDENIVSLEKIGARTCKRVRALVHEYKELTSEVEE